MRHEIDATVAAIADTLVEHFGDRISRIWVKGSAQKAWDGPIDYVPELSDVDIHLHAADDRVQAELGDLGTALRLHEAIGRRFASAVPAPAHMPKPQVVVANDLEDQVDYVSAATVIWNARDEPPPTAPAADPQVLRGIDARRLVSTAEDPALRTVVADLVEQPGRYAHAALRHLNWRVSPVAPRVLHVLGVDFTEAWTMNRTHAVRHLGDLECADLAEAYASYYLAAWQGFLSGWADGEAMRTAVAAGMKAIRLGAELATSRSV
jgi:hypothetical protein